MAGVNLIKTLETQSKSAGSRGFTMTNVDLTSLTQVSDDPKLSRAENTKLIVALLGVMAIFVGRNQVTAFINREVLTRNAELSSIKTQIAGEDAKLREREGIKQEIANYEAQMQSLREQLAAVEAVQKNRNSVVRMIDFVMTQVPDSIWIQEIDIKTGDGAGADNSRFDLKGNAIDLQSVSVFTKKLEGAVFFPVWEIKNTATSVENLRSTRNGTGGQVEVRESKTFEISAKIQSL